MTLAARMPLAEISMSDLANEAGVSRATVYNHATTPLDLARDVIRGELSRQQAAFERSFDKDSRREAYSSGLRILARHLVDNKGLYQTEREATSGKPIMELLADFATTATQELLEQHPEILPEPANPMMVPVLAAAVAHGALGAIDAWMQLGEQDEDDLVTHLLLTVPPWLLG